MHNGVFLELSLVIIFTLSICGLMKALKQPIMIGYILSGILLSPNVFNLIQNTDSLNTFSEIGISFLLFMIGLNLNLKHIKEVGKTALIATFCQVSLTCLIYFIFGKFFGFTDLYAICLAIGLSISSTIVIVKLLTDRLTLESLPGKITVGILIIQDLLIIAITMFISATRSEETFAIALAETLLKGSLLIGILFFVGAKILPKITKKVAKSQELLLLFSIGWCMAIASIFQLFNFSLEMGALLAGISLSFSPFRYEITSKMRPLRDFFIMLFFVLLGAQIVFADLINMIVPIAVFSIAVMFLNPMIMTFLIGRLGYTKNTSFQVGINFGQIQISEFSLVLASIGLKAGHIDHNILSVLTIIGLITITGSNYFINYSDKIYRPLAKHLKFIERKGHKIDQHRNFDRQEHEIILIGYAKMGVSLVESFKHLGKKFFVVDYDPQIIQELTAEDVNCMYGDISNAETFEEINFTKTRMVISTLKDLDSNLLLISKLKKISPDTIIIVLSHQIEEALHLYEQGANYVIMPYHLGSHHTSIMLSEYGFNLEKFHIEKKSHINKLLIKKQLSPSKHK